MHIIKSVLSLALSSLISLTASAVNVSDFADLDKYVGVRSSVSPAPFNYLQDGSQYLQLAANGTKIVKIDTRTGNEIETVMDVNNTRESKISRIEGYTLSPEGTKILVYTNRRNIYRHSFDAIYYVYEIRTRLLKPLSTEFERQQAPLFSPDGRMVAFAAADNNIHLKKLDYGTELPVTTDGEVNKIINGIPDWTYQEEFATESSMTWAPDNLTLCYIKYNESDVPMFSFPLYEGSCNPMTRYALYPGAFTYKYPVAGQNNSVVSVHSYDVETRKTKKIDLPDSRIEYIPRITYAFSPDRLIVTTLNRAQTRMEMYSVNPKSTVSKSLLVEEYKAWLSPKTYENIHYYPTFFVIFSSRTGYDHLYRYSYAGALEQQITSGDYDVTDYYGYDSKRDCHFYQSTVSGAINRVVSFIDKKGKITDLSPTEGTASARFSPDMAYYTLSHSTALTPPVHTLYNAAGKEIKVLENNATYAARYANAPKKEFFTMSHDGITLNGYMIKPADFNQSKRYPVIMYQYSGPGSQQVLNQWGINWTYYFATQGYIIICVDGRGTGGRGREFMDVVYKNLGHYESIDQISAAKYAASLPYVDPSRIGIHGWSYGGFETLMASSQPDAPYAAAVSVAPVTNWRYYDSIYTERYMLTPQENDEGYNISTPMNLIKNVRCPILVMTGTADDNVHYFNTVQYVSALEAAGTWCDLLIFPNMNHSINGCNSSSVVYARMLDYFNKNMK